MKSNGIIWLAVLVCLHSCLGKKSAIKNEGAQNESSPPESSPESPSEEEGNPVNPINPVPEESFDDPLYQHLWHLDNTGQSAFAARGGTAGQDINWEGVRALGVSGAGIKIAVSDSGLETSHPEFAGRLLAGQHRNYSLSSPYIGSPTPAGVAGDHGTSVAGIIIAGGGNDIGVRGIAWQARVAGFKYIGHATLATQLHQATGDFDIFNYSYGNYPCAFPNISATYIAQLKTGVTGLRNNKGAIYVKSAGNEFISFLRDCYPGTTIANNYYFGNANLNGEHQYPWVIVVGALDADGISASYSSPGSSVWVSAPGGEFGRSKPAIITTDRPGCAAGYARTGADTNAFEDAHAQNPTCDYTSRFNGTSAAAGVVSGVVALMLQANPNLTWRDVKHILAASATRVDSSRGVTRHPSENLNLAGHNYQEGWTANGEGYSFHNWYGFGGVNALAAVNMARNSYTSPFSAVQTSTNWADTSGSTPLSLAITDNTSAGVFNSINVDQNLTIEAVQVRLSVTHSYIGDLGVELVSPSGTKSILLNINSNIQGSNITNEILLSNAFYMERSRGSWTLKVIDGAADDTGTLDSWAINIIGH